ncbi:unnamed protein product [Leptidea sinapis]|uniref:RBR-type E3 ubiquitin transferase n=1 Tax=Leptidea sinapis TaxID=189913 RepID=A0A5E4PNW9_9NEOP|nr:unnamed protein product [Leptidea sinapis]
MSVDSDMEYSDNDGDEYGDYYGEQDDCEMETVDQSKTDPEYFLFSCLRVEEVEKLLNESIELLSNSLQITPSLAKVILHAYDWNAQEIIDKYKENPNEVLIHSRVKPRVPSLSANISCSTCAVCATANSTQKYSALTCGHYFCNECWAMHFEVQIMQGVSNTIQCMAQECEVIAPEDFVLSHVAKPTLRDRYQQFMFKDHLKSHPQLRFCPGPNCQWIFRAWVREGARRVECQGCELLTCFSCGAPHHAPTDCITIRLWLTKCADDSETANYISAHTKAREALKKYLHYYERWENHARSLKLEEQTLASLKSRINQKAQLEAEIENLSWKVERAETTDRGDLENQMDIAEKRRTILLKDFLDINTNCASSSKM